MDKSKGKKSPVPLGKRPARSEPDPNDPVSKLKAPQRKFLEAWLSGLDVQKAGRQAGIAHNTAYNYSHDANIKAIYDRCMLERMPLAELASLRAEHVKAMKRVFSVDGKTSTEVPDFAARDAGLAAVEKSLGLDKPRLSARTKTSRSPALIKLSIKHLGLPEQPDERYIRDGSYLVAIDEDGNILAEGEEVKYTPEWWRKKLGRGAGEGCVVSGDGRGDVPDSAMIGDEKLEAAADATIENLETANAGNSESDRVDASLPSVDDLFK
jgi:hypothetical protein